MVLARRLVMPGLGTRPQNLSLNLATPPRELVAVTIFWCGN